MNKTKILKAIDLIKSERLADALELLQIEAVRCDDKRAGKLCDVVKRYLKRAITNNPSRDWAGTVLHQDGKQYICDGFTVYYFDVYRPELETLPQSAEGVGVSATGLLSMVREEYRPLTAEELEACQHIKQYITYYKTLDDKWDGCPLAIWGRTIDTQWLAQTSDIIGGDWESMQVAIPAGWTNPVKLHNDNVTVMILPLRVDDKERERLAGVYNRFCELLRGEGSNEN